MDKEVYDELREIIMGFEEIRQKAVMELYDFERSFRDVVDNETALETFNRCNSIGKELNNER